MSQNYRQNRKNQVRKPESTGHKGVDIWKPVPAPPDVVKIAAAKQPDALIVSLGDPPLGQRGVIAGHYLAAVIERAATLASALAASADLLALEADNDA